MGYRVLIESSDFRILEENYQTAFNALCELETFSYLKDCDDLVDALQTLDFTVELNPHGIAELGYYSNTGEEDLALETIAPFVEDGSYICWAGEDRNDLWKNVFHAGEIETRAGAFYYEGEGAFVDDPALAMAVRAIDPKGRIPIAEFDRCALLYRPENTYQPYVVAYGYDKDTGEWSHGSYYGDLGHAFDEANPEIIEEASVRWEIEDVREKLEEYDVDVTDYNVAEVLTGDIGIKPVAKYMRDNMIASGHEDLNDRIHSLKDQNRFIGQGDAAQKGDKGYSLSSEHKDAQAAKTALAHNGQDAIQEKDAGAR